MHITKLNDLLSHEDQLQSMLDSVNAMRGKNGQALLDIEVLRTEYTLAKAVDEAKEAGDTNTVTATLRALIDHQKQYGL